MTVGIIGEVGHVAMRGAEGAAKAARAERSAGIRRDTERLRAGLPRTPGAAVAVRQGSALVSREPINGAELLRDTRKFLRHFALWPSEAALNVATLAVAAMHAKDGDGDPIWEYAFKMLFTAGEYGAGKSWFAKLVASLAPAGQDPARADQAVIHR